MPSSEHDDAPSRETGGGVIKDRAGAGSDNNSIPQPPNNGHDAETQLALDIARNLAAYNVPIFFARPAINDAGEWDATGGHNGCGYWLPRGWHLTVADPAVLDYWQPGLAVAAVMGGPLDGLDVDPRSGGGRARDELQAAGLWPYVIGEAATPSGGEHYLVNPLGVRSHDKVMPGFDVKAGVDEGHTRDDGTPDNGHGFLFIAPTVRQSKTTQELTPYAWTIPPNFDELDAADTSGQGIAETVKASHVPVTDEAPEAPTTHKPWEQLTQENKDKVDRYLKVVLERETAVLVDASTWSEGRTDDRHRGWQKMVADWCNRLGRLARATWTPWTTEQALAHAHSTIPAVLATAVPVAATWRAQHHRRSPIPWPPTLDKDPYGGLTVIEGPDSAATAPGAPGESNGTAAKQPRRHVALTAAASIAPRPVRWLWDGRLALGTLGLLAGREGLGKSTLAYWLAARITQGELAGEDHGTPRAVLVAATEDSWAHTVIPRLMAAGADLNMIYKVEAINADDIEVGLSLPHDLIGIENRAREVDAGLLILDPLVSRLGSLDTHKDAEVRQALEPLVAVADRARFAILGLIHHNKSDSSDPLQLVMASKAFTAVARSVHTVIEDPDDQTRRLFGTPKNNLGTTAIATLTFAITSAAIETEEGTAWTGQLQWGEDSNETIQSAMGRSQDPDERSATTEAAEWLEDWLAPKGGEASSADAKKAARAAGHTDKTLRRAREKLRINVTSSGFPRTTYWALSVEPDPNHSRAHQSCPSPWGECVEGMTVCPRAQQRRSEAVASVVPSPETGASPGAPLEEDTIPELAPQPPQGDTPTCPCGKRLHEIYVASNRTECPGHEHMRTGAAR